MKTAISIRNLSKKYVICHEASAGYSTLVETLAGKARSFFSRVQGKPHTKKYEDFFALKDINIDIEEGDRVGIVGRNGSGKSTLLKLISRITYPSTGHIGIRGRISSLLEVGTGFHLELTGRENIFLNGSILGMQRSEIIKKFDEIVAFSEVEQFLDTPVKRYSSGMFTRLGFAIAAHLDPDILIVDEVLAVGDTQFQDKCLRKLNELGEKGRTVLFVSHDTSSILSLCNKGIYLEKGQMVASGPIDQCVDAYMKSIRTASMIWQGSVGDEHIRFLEAKLEMPHDGKMIFRQGEPVRISLKYEILKYSSDLFLGWQLCNTRGQVLAQSYTHDLNDDFLNKGERTLSFTFDTHNLFGGDYLLKINAGILHTKSIAHDAIILKLPLCQIDTNARFSAPLHKHGVFLGKNWKEA